jgi:hypothetical protein
LKSDRCVLDQCKRFLELIGNQQNARALIAATAIREHVTKCQFAVLERCGELLRIRESIRFILAGDVQRHQSSS